MAEQTMPLAEALALVEREAKAINNGLYGRLALALTTLCAAVRRMEAADKALRAVWDNWWTVKCDEEPLADGDTQIVWRVLEHQTGKPPVAIGHGLTPLEAIADALATVEE